MTITGHLILIQYTTEIFRYSLFLLQIYFFLHSLTQVTILNESHYPDWNINEFRMMRGDTVRTIRHFHFTTWPDFGVPEPPQTLVRYIHSSSSLYGIIQITVMNVLILRFVRAFRERVSPEQRPIVAHCSAGVGRSGTFIALDRILQVSFFL